MPNVTLYVTSQCARCVAIKGRLHTYNIEHDVINLEDDAELMQQMKTAGFLAAPILKVDDTYFGSPTTILGWIKAQAKAT